MEFFKSLDEIISELPRMQFFKSLDEIISQLPSLQCFKRLEAIICELSGMKLFKSLDEKNFKLLFPTFLISLKFPEISQNVATLYNF